MDDLYQTLCDLGFGGWFGSERAYLAGLINYKEYLDLDSWLKEMALRNLVA